MSAPLIRVLFVDADTQVPIAGSELAAEELPETFAVATTVHIRDEQYEVVHAEPATRAAIVARGSVRIALRKLHTLDPQELRYSLPTIQAELPLLGSATVGDALRVRGDDWCQVEFWPAARLAELRQELAQVQAVYADTPARTGFTDLHARRVRSPMRGTGLDVRDLADFGPVHARLLAVEGFDGVNYEVLGGFAFDGATAQLYGAASDGPIDALAWLQLRAPFACVEGCPPPLDLGADRDRLATICTRHALVLVDWCAAAVLLPEPLQP